MKAIIPVLACFIPFLLLSACGGGADLDSVGPELREAAAVDARHIRVKLTQAADARSLDRQSYSIVHGDGQRLPILDVSQSGNDSSLLLLTTSQQRPGDYAVELVGSFAGRSSTAVFAGSQQPALELSDVMAVSHSEILLNFNRAVDASLLEPAAYSLVSMTGQPLSIVQAVIGSDPAQVVLQTESQQNTSYLLTVEPEAGTLHAPYFDRAHGARRFKGLEQNDQTPPELMAVQVISPTQLLLSFSEPVITAADFLGRLNFDPALEPISFETERRSSQIRLNTEVMQHARAYTLTLDATAVRDHSELGGGNFLADNARSVRFSGGGNGPVVADTERPRIVSAVAIANSQVLVTFTEELRGGDEGAENPQHFAIQVSPRSSEAVAARVGVLEARVVRPGGLSVLLTTQALSGVEYQLSTVALTDLAGNSFEPPGGGVGGVDPSKTFFFGVPESGSAIDSDEDGINDAGELYGWPVIITDAAGREVERWVTSNPDSRDTDADGVPDDQERQAGSDPRSADTDGDTLSDNDEWNIILSDPTHQDSDGDGAQDGSEFYGWRTSPILADTDGDQLSDTEEVLSRNRNPRLADMPGLSIEVGDLRLSLDQHFTYVDESGTTSTIESGINATLATEEQQISGVQFMWWDEGFGHFVAGKAETDTSLPFFQISGGASGGTSRQTSLESAVSTLSAREASFSSAREQSGLRSMTRELVGARIDADVRLINTGNLAFSVSNLEITVLKPSPTARGKLVPVATLVPSSGLLAGEPAIYHLGPYATERGPLIFSNIEVFPDEVDRLMKSPTGALVFEIANYDLSDEYGRVFSFSNQFVRDRTARLIIDGLGGPPQVFHVSTAQQPDVDCIMGPPCDFVGGFESDGLAKGVPIDFALRDVLKLQKDGQIPDAIVAGPDGRPDTYAQGDDVQQIPAGAEGAGSSTVVISAGRNGVLDTLPVGDDQAVVATGYAVSATCSANSGTRAGLACGGDPDCIESDGSGNTVVQGSCSGPTKLQRFGELADGDFDRRWVVLGSHNTPLGADFSDIVLYPGHDVHLLFVQDLDRDGLFAREEFLLGSVDSKQDLYDNETFGVLNLDAFDDGIVSLHEVRWADGGDGIADSRDSDRDGLDDFVEARVGWMVSREAASAERVYSSAALADTDGDGLLDPVERNLGGLCDLLDSDGRLGNGINYCDFPSLNIGSAGFASDVRLDPTAPDTDADGLEDGAEFFGFALGPVIRDRLESEGGARSAENLARTQAQGDDIQLVRPGDPLSDGDTVILSGPNQKLESTPAPGDVLQAGGIVVTDPLRADSDSDRVPDAVELLKGANPRDPTDAEKFIDSDQDGISDHDESVIGWMVNPKGRFFTVIPAYAVKSNPSRPDSDFDGLPDYLERILRTDPNSDDTDQDGISDFDEIDDGIIRASIPLQETIPAFSLDAEASARYGTDPTDQDTDDDLLSDYSELISGNELVNDFVTTYVFTNPLLEDTDGDGLTDPLEFYNADSSQRTNASLWDTDGDGQNDSADQYPLVPDLSAILRAPSVEINVTAADGGGTAEFAWWIIYEVTDVSGVTKPTKLLSSAAWADLGVQKAITFGKHGTDCDVLGGFKPSAQTSWIFPITKKSHVSLKQGENITIRGVAGEIDGASQECGHEDEGYLPRIFHSQCRAAFSESFSYDDLSAGPVKVQGFDFNSSWSCEVKFEIDIQVP